MAHFHATNGSRRELLPKQPHSHFTKNVMKKILLLAIGVQIGISISQLIKLKKMADELKNLQDAVAKETTVDEGAITLLNGLKTALDAAIAANDPAALQSLSDSLGAESTKLADAVTSNTPAASAS